MKPIDEIIYDINENCTKPFVTARFGENWKRLIKEQLESGECDIYDIIDIAWRQGRKAVLLEEALRSVYAWKNGNEKHLLEMALRELISRAPDPQPYNIRATGATPILAWFVKLFKRK
jgi:hypothetical protein